MTDLRYAFRQLLKQPGFTALVMLHAGARRRSGDQVPERDPVAVIISFALVALRACLIPGIRATRVNPMDALRTE